MLALWIAPGESRADDVDELADKMERIERDLRQLERDVYKGHPPATESGAAAVGGPPGGGKLNDVESSLRELRGQVETLAEQVRRLSENFEVARKEMDFRFGALEGGAPAGAVPRGSVAVGGPTSAPAPKPAPVQNPGSFGAPIKLAPGAGSNIQGQKPGELGTLPATIDESGPGGASPRQQYDAAMDLMTRAQYPEAQSAFRGFVAAYPADELAGPAQYWVGDIAFAHKDYAGAAKSFAELLKRYAKTARAPDAMLKLGLSLLELGQKKEGCTTLGAVRSKYPNANKAILDRAAKRAAEAGCK